VYVAGLGFIFLGLLLLRILLEIQDKPQQPQPHWRIEQKWKEVPTFP
jgi:hypothetical protein